jgi:hypothetical protein
MAEKKEKKKAPSLRTPQPKKLGLSVPPLLRLPHEELIRAPQQENEDEQSIHDSSHPSDSKDARVDAGQTNSQRGVKSASTERPTSHADSARLANLDGAKTASLAKNDAVGPQISRLANRAGLAESAGLQDRAGSISLMSSLPDTNGFTKLHHQIVDHLYCQLSAKEQVVHLQLYRLSWGRGQPKCFMNLPKLARRSNLSERSVGEAVGLLESKGLIHKAAVVTGKGKEQGIEYWVTPAPSLAKNASLAIPASLATAASLAKSEPDIEDKEERHEEHTHKEERVGVSSKFTLEECRQYAQHLQQTGQGITNPGGYATTIHRSGEADDSIVEFLKSQQRRIEASLCPDCDGQGFKLVQRDGREGAVRCQHERLKQEKSGE